jgi:hypothetical protein
MRSWLVHIPPRSLPPDSFSVQIKRLGFHLSPPTEFPKKEEYDREKPDYVPIEQQTEAQLRVRKMRHGWVEPRYY